MPRIFLRKYLLVLVITKYITYKLRIKHNFTKQSDATIAVNYGINLVKFVRNIAMSHQNVILLDLWYHERHSCVTLMKSSKQILPKRYDHEN